MNDPFMAVRDILEAAASLKVASHRMEAWLKEKNYPTGSADSVRALAIDLEETARKFVAQVRTSQSGAPEP